MGQWYSGLEKWRLFWQDVRRDLARFPWRNTALTLRERFREDRLGETASSLTFTTVMALVPLFTVALAIFSALPAFANLETNVEKWLIQSLVPSEIARSVLKYLHQFSSKAGQLGWLGAGVLLATALALILTIDRKLNDIWRVRELRPFSQRVLTYWGVLTLGPLLLGGSISLTTYLFTASNGVAAGYVWLLDLFEYLVVVVALASLYYFVPNAKVRWSHAFIGGLLMAIGLEVVKRLLAVYIKATPTFSAVYGAFATVPILLVWLYMAWLIILFGAVMVAYLPSLLRGVSRRNDQAGWDYQLAIDILSLLHHAKQSTAGVGVPGLSADDLASALRIDALALEKPMAALTALDWVGRLDEDEPRYVLIADLARMPLAPLVDALLLPKTTESAAMWAASDWDRRCALDAVVRTGQ
jgi:membrane protein